MSHKVFYRYCTTVILLSEHCKRQIRASSTAQVPPATHASELSSEPILNHPQISSNGPKEARRSSVCPITSNVSVLVCPSLPARLKRPLEPGVTSLAVPPFVTNTWRAIVCISFTFFAVLGHISPSVFRHPMLNLIWSLAIARALSCRRYLQAERSARVPSLIMQVVKGV